MKLTYLPLLGALYSTGSQAQEPYDPRVDLSKVPPHIIPYSTAYGKSEQFLKTLVFGDEDISGMRAYAVYEGEETSLKRIKMYEGKALFKIPADLWHLSKDVQFYAVDKDGNRSENYFHREPLVSFLKQDQKLPREESLAKLKETYGDSLTNIDISEHLHEYDWYFILPRYEICYNALPRTADIRVSAYHEGHDSVQLSITRQEDRRTEAEKAKNRVGTKNVCLGVPEEFLNSNTMVSFQPAINGIFYQPSKAHTLEGFLSINQFPGPSREMPQVNLSVTESNRAKVVTVDISDDNAIGLRGFLSLNGEKSELTDIDYSQPTSVRFRLPSSLVERGSPFYIAAGDRDGNIMVERFDPIKSNY